MLCGTCGNNCPEEDFLLESKDCFRCVYQRKLKKFEVPAPPESRQCVICNARIPDGKRKYCSDECGYVQKMKQDRERWYRKISSQGNPFN